MKIITMEIRLLITQMIRRKREVKNRDWKKYLSGLWGKLEVLVGLVLMRYHLGVSWQEIIN